MDENDTGEDGYLILTRRPNETLRIGDNILVHVVSVGRNVRLSIEAPDDQRILRSELLERPQPSESRQADAQRVAEPKQAYAADAAPSPRQQPVVQYRRRRKLMTLGSSGRKGSDTPGRN